MYQRAISKPVATGVTVAAIALSLTVALVQYQRHESLLADREKSKPLTVMPTTRYSESELRDKDIEFYAKRSAEDTSSATDRLTLAGLLFSRSRNTGSVADLARAETLARESIAARTRRNYQAFELLASVLMTSHRFVEARSVALLADSLDPAVPSHLALLGEIELELGDYNAAAVHFQAVQTDNRQYTIGARLARWYELTGHLDMARQLLRRAIVSVDRRDDLSRDQVAWFHYRLGELELRGGNTAAADSAFNTGLLRHPDDVRILGGLARSALARSEWQGAIDFGERGIAIQLDPATLGTVSRAYAQLGDTAQAASYARAMSVSALKQPGEIHRAWGLFLLDHGSTSDKANVLERAQRELRTRKDVYGHDLVAWALFRSGRLAEARSEMKLALSQHTEDVMLTQHARALGLIGRDKPAA